MSAGDIYKLTAVFLNNGTGENQTTGIHFTQQAGLPLDMGISDTGPVMKDWWSVGLGGAAALKTFCSPDMSLVRIEQRMVQPLSAVVLQYVVGLPIVGTASGDDLPPGSSVVASLRTGRVGKSYRGRMYLPTFTEAFCNADGNLTSGDALSLADGVVTLIRAINAIVIGDPVVDVYSRVLSSGEAVTDVKVDQRIRNQRRRTVRTPVYSASVV
jgi:hypothetical protein